MKTRNSQRFVLIVSLAALLGSPAFAAFGDNTAPETPTVSGNSAPGSALPPGTYPSSPSGSNDSAGDRKAEPSKNDKATPPKNPSTKHSGSKKNTQKTPRTGS